MKIVKALLFLISFGVCAQAEYYEITNVNHLYSYHMKVENRSKVVEAQSLVLDVGGERAFIQYPATHFKARVGDVGKYLGRYTRYGSDVLILDVAGHLVVTGVAGVSLAEEGVFDAFADRYVRDGEFESDRFESMVGKPSFNYVEDSRFGGASSGMPVASNFYNFRQQDSLCLDDTCPTDGVILQSNGKIIGVSFHYEANNENRLKFSLRLSEALSEIYGREYSRGKMYELFTYDAKFDTAVIVLPENKMVLVSFYDLPGKAESVSYSVVDSKDYFKAMGLPLPK
ncbi:hypothetical protein AB4254_12250 [Vibrio breoganii]